MAKIKISLNEIANINYFENYTKLKTKDSFNDDAHDKLVFIVQNGEIKKLLKNKKGISIIHKLEQKFNKKLRIIEFNQNPVSFVKNAILPLKADNVLIDEEKNIIIIQSKDRNLKSMVIGKSASNLNSLKKMVNRYFSISDIIVE